MLIYKISSQPCHHDTILESNGVVTEYVVPAPLNFLTTVGLASKCKKKNPDAVITYKPSQALAAVSARKINRTTKDTPLPYPIIFYVTSETKVPLSIYREVAEGIDAIVYENEATRKNWHKVKNIDLVKVSSVIPRPADNEYIEKNENNSATVLVYAGPIGKAETLGRILDKIARLDESIQPEVNVLGTAKARYIMPVVKRARANKLNVNWLGENTEPDTAFAQADGFIISSPGSPCEIEKQLMAMGVPPVAPETIDQWLDPQQRKTMSAEAKKIYAKEYTADVYANRIKNLLNSLK